MSEVMAAEETASVNTSCNLPVQFVGALEFSLANLNIPMCLVFLSEAVSFDFLEVQA